MHRLRYLREGALLAGPAEQRQSASAQGLDGAGLAQKCPFDAIMIINLPKNLEKETTHRYGPNSFKLHRRGSGTAPQPMDSSLACTQPR